MCPRNTAVTSIPQSGQSRRLMTWDTSSAIAELHIIGNLNGKHTGALRHSPPFICLAFSRRSTLLTPSSTQCASHFRITLLTPHYSGSFASLRLSSSRAKLPQRRVSHKNRCQQSYAYAPILLRNASVPHHGVSRCSRRLPRHNHEVSRRKHREFLG